MQQLLSQLLGLGCSQMDLGDAELRAVERDFCAPEDFYSTPIIELRSAADSNGSTFRTSAWMPS